MRQDFPTIRSCLSEKEIAMFDSLGWADAMSTVSIAPIAFYRMAALDAFINNKHGKSVESLRRTTKELEKGHIYRNTPEFEALIEIDSHTINKRINYIVNYHISALPYMKFENFCNLVSCEIDDEIEEWLNSKSKKSLQEYLGLSDEEYGLFMLDQSSFIRKIIANYTKN